MSFEHRYIYDILLLRVLMNLTRGTRGTKSIYKKPKFFVFNIQYLQFIGSLRPKSRKDVARDLK